MLEDTVLRDIKGSCYFQDSITVPGMTFNNNFVHVVYWLFVALGVQNPRPHISLAYALGDVVEALAVVATELNIMAHSQEEKRGVAGDRVVFWSAQASKVECKVGQKIFPIWTANP